MSLKELPEIAVLLEVAREVVKVSEQMRFASVGDLGELEVLALTALGMWDNLHAGDD